MSVGQIARDGDEVVSANKGARIQRVAQLMKDNSVGSVVIEDDDEPVGIVTDRDLTLHVLANNKNPETLIAADVMSDDLITVSSEDNVFTLCAQMRQHHIRRVPVVDDDGTIAGFTALDDIIVCLEDEIDKIEQISNDLAGVIEAASPTFGR
jgi:signal-transduction protein with cAMP-binding, CBS, and nucleotidyltransferase domain